MIYIIVHNSYLIETKQVSNTDCVQFSGEFMSIFGLISKLTLNFVLFIHLTINKRRQYKLIVVSLLSLFHMSTYINRHILPKVLKINIGVPNWESYYRFISCKVALNTSPRNKHYQKLSKHTFPLCPPPPRVHVNEYVGGERWCNVWMTSWMGRVIPTQRNPWKPPRWQQPKALNATFKVYYSSFNQLFTQKNSW